MLKRFLAIACFAAFAATPVRAADEYTVDPVHSSVSFKISHAGLSWIHGRFNAFSGTFMIDADDAAKSSFALTIPR